MKYSPRPALGGDRERLPEKEKKEERLQILQLAIFGQNQVPEKDFEAFRGAESMKMKCRSVWDTSRGLKPSKMAEKCDVTRICFFIGKKS